jgi:hypothetical protein
MPASYPSSPKTFTTLADNVDDALASHQNEVRDEIAALEAALLTGGFAHHLKFVDALYDIGQSGAVRPRHLFLAGNAVIGGTLAVTGAVTVGGAALVTTKGLFSGRTGSVVAGSTVYVGISESAAETDQYLICPVAGTVRNLYVQTDGPPGGAETFTYTVRKNGADQTVTCVVSAAAITGNDTTHSFVVAAGDKLTVKLVTSGGASTRKHQFGVEVAA